MSGFIDRQILVLLVQPIRRDLDLTLTEMSYLIGLPFAIFYTLMGLPIARLADSTNRRNVISGGIALWSLMTALCGLAGTYWRLLLARVGVGVGEAALQAPAASMIADSFPREKLGSAMGVYSMGVFIGSGLAYIIGGWVVGIASAQESWTWPVVGTIRPWQSVFLFVGIPGLLVALLLLTVREPERADRSQGTVPISEFFAYVRRNARTYFCLSIGYAMSATVNYGIAAWLATFLVQKHGFPASQAGIIMGTLTLTIGTAGVFAGGKLADVLVRRGYTDGALRVGIAASLGMLVSATAYPFAGSRTAALAWLVIVNFFAAFPWGAASAAAAQLAPARIRAQSVSVYVLVLNFISFALGPYAVAAVTDNIFGDDAALPFALAIVNVVGMTLAISLFVLGLSAFRRTLATRDSWSVEAA